MKGIQNEIIISQKAFIYYTYLWVTPLLLLLRPGGNPTAVNNNNKNKKYQRFSEYTSFTINFNVYSPGGRTNIQAIFDLVPRCLKHVWRCRSHSDPCAGFQVLKVVDLNLVDNALHIIPQEKVQWGKIW
jgi:hypothetical protein